VLADGEDKSRARQKVEQAGGWLKDKGAALAKTPDAQAAAIGEAAKQAGFPTDALGQQLKDGVELAPLHAPYLTNKAALHQEHLAAANHKPAVTSTETGFEVKREQAAAAEAEQRKKMDQLKQFQQTQQKRQGRSMRRF
jgi:hypothetical protein